MVRRHKSRICCRSSVSKVVRIYWTRVELCDVESDPVRPIGGGISRKCWIPQKIVRGGQSQFRVKASLRVTISTTYGKRLALILTRRTYKDIKYLIPVLFGVDGAVVLAWAVVDFAVVNVVFAVDVPPDELPEPVPGIH